MKVALHQCQILQPGVVTGPLQCCTAGSRRQESTCWCLRGLLEHAAPILPLPLNSKVNIFRLTTRCNLMKGGGEFLRKVLYSNKRRDDGLAINAERTSVVKGLSGPRKMYAAVLIF